jgi:uncharacterized protein with HEPN domain
MNVRDKKALMNIDKHIKVIFQYMTGISSLYGFSNNSLVQDAVVFNLLQIGELAKSKLSDSFKKTHSDIPWNDVYGFRNRLVHDYESIRLTIVYESITEDLPKLQNLIGKVIKD